MQVTEDVRRNFSELGRVTVAIGNGVAGHACGNGSTTPCGTVFQRKAACRVDTQLLGSVQVNIRGRLAQGNDIGRVGMRDQISPAL